ncbi:hypothetical protein MBLNU457_g2977t2 [Dothideomycetes sp. NU457]
MSGIATMLFAADNDQGRSPLMSHKSSNDTVFQLVLSIALGVSCFLAFCILRPRWSSLYAARKRNRQEADALPDLPNTLFGWMLPLWRVTDQQILAAAGLDAYVFLRFFRMAATYLGVILFFALVVIKPVHDANPDDTKEGKRKHEDNSTMIDTLYQRQTIRIFGHDTPMSEWETDYLWMYLVFVYFFSIFAMYIIVSNTRQVIEVRQEYLGTQTTVTDRTIRLSGIPKDLQSEDKIKQFMEGLNIGKVESVTLCRNWKELDKVVVERNVVLRKLEEALTVHLRYRTVERNLETLPIVQPLAPGPAPNRDEGDDQEDDQLIDVGSQAQPPPYARVRPKMTIRFGLFKLRSKQVDAIDHYREKLKTIDDKIRELRASEFQTTPMAFVTMDTVAGCQMAVQAVLDPSPLQLLANLSPAPSDVVWTNTYLSRRHRIIRAWSITVLIVLLTLVWSVLLVPIATALNTEAIKKFLPPLGNWLDDHPFFESLVNTQLPTIIASLLNVAVPYLYDWLSNCQGMTSQGDVELSVISKNFFFTFFNFFVLFTVLGTASNAYSLFKNFGDALRDTTRIAYILAESLEGLKYFYACYIILQGLGLYPLRLAQVASMALYPVSRIGARTPRDYAELVQPPTFSYGFYLPQTLLILIICMVYSVLRDSWLVLLPGFIYFLIGGYVHKYQLLYSMDHREHSTGKSWIMMCDRMLVGLVVFQLAVGGQLGSKKAYWRGILTIPLLLATIWFSYAYNKTYRPLMKYIALKSVRLAEHADFGYTDEDLPEDMARWRYDSETDGGRHVDESRETGLRFVNPSLIAPLEPVWIADKSVPNADEYRDNVDGEEEEEV